jgi:hypothetical protein
MSGSCHSAVQNVLEHSFIFPSSCSAECQVNRTVIKLKDEREEVTVAGTSQHRLRKTKEKKKLLTIRTARLVTDI